MRCVTTTLIQGASEVSLSVVAAPATSVMGIMKVSTTKVVIIATEAVRAHLPPAGTHQSAVATGHDTILH
eukprot:5295319-Pyramimonas_sp.AAC.1